MKKKGRSYRTKARAKKVKSQEVLRETDARVFDEPLTVWDGKTIEMDIVHSDIPPQFEIHPLTRLFRCLTDREVTMNLVGDVDPPICPMCGLRMYEDASP